MPFLNPTYILALLIAVSVHEWAHAMTATRLGDPTPGDHGRLTINPIAHIDPMGALLFLTVGFGWAKPVPINPLYFRRPTRDMVLTALAGPASNLILASVAFVILAIAGSTSASPWDLLELRAGGVAMTFLIQLAGASLFINLGLMAFNLLPIAPLDGSNIVRIFVPLKHNDRFDEFLRVGPYILLGIFIAEYLFHIPLLSTWIVTIMEWTLAVMGTIAGVFI